MKADSRAAVIALAQEIKRRDEWYGLDNWSFAEVVDFVLEHAGVDAEPAPHVEYGKTEPDA